MALGLKRAEHS